jgi:hypothetical protein
MFTHDPTPPHPSLVRSRLRRSDDHCPPRVIVGSPIGDGRVAYVQTFDIAAPRDRRDEVLISLYGLRPKGDGEELLLRTSVRQCDLWNGEFDGALAGLVSWAGWVLTRLERREVAPGSA